MTKFLVRGVVMRERAKAKQTPPLIVWSSQEESTNEAIQRLAKQPLDDYKHMLSEVNYWLADLHRENQYASDFNTYLPLSWWIMKESILSQFKNFQMDLYNDTIDPLDHLKVITLLY